MLPLRNSLLLILSFLIVTLATAQSEMPTPEQLAQEQLDAYNARDIDAFLAPYADSVEIYNFPDQFVYAGKENMRSRYGNMFEKTPDLHCELVNRIVMGNTVIDQEKVTGIPGRELLEAIAIYKIKDGKIAQVYFVRKD
ncbi:MAG: nuclear transport factor 2 family protein [Bacteroidota bacterium]